MLTETNRFRPDNTEGYTIVQLDELNRRYMERAESLFRANVTELASAPEWWMKSELDHIAEQVQAEYDTETSSDQKPAQPMVGIPSIYNLFRA